MHFNTDLMVINLLFSHKIGQKNLLFKLNAKIRCTLFWETEVYINLGTVGRKTPVYRSNMSSLEFRSSISSREVVFGSLLYTHVNPHCTCSQLPIPPPPQAVALSYLCALRVAREEAPWPVHMSANDQSSRLATWRSGAFPLSSAGECLSSLIIWLFIGFHLRTQITSKDFIG
jgi:hypothetical protein